MPTDERPNGYRVAVRVALALCVVVLLMAAWRVWVHDKTEVQITDKFSVRGHAMPRQEGSVRFVGTLYVKGAVAAKTRFVFLFDNDFVSAPIDTNGAGAFEYTLPVGHWKLLAPYVPGLSGNTRFDIEPPVQRRELSFDVSAGAIAQTYRLVLHAD